MKIFEYKTQNKLSELFLAIFTIVTIGYVVIPILNINGVEWKSSYYIEIFSISLSLFVLLFRYKLPLLTKANILVILLLIIGMSKHVNNDMLTGYFLLIIATIFGSFFLKQKNVFLLMIVGLFSIIVIDIAIYNGYFAIENNKHEIQSLSILIERNIQFAFITLLITWSLTTFRKSTKEALSLTQQEKIKYQPLFDQSYSFISVLDFNGNVVESNQAALFYIQKKIEDVKGKYFPTTTWWNHSEADQLKIENALNACKSGDFKRFEAIHRNFDGAIEQFDYTLKPIFDDDFTIKYIIAEGRDITRIKKTEQALIEGEERLIALSESTYEGLIITDNGNIVEANNSALKLFKLNNINDVIGNNAITMFTHPDDISIIEEHLKDSNPKPYEIRGIRSDGTTILLEIEGRDIIYKGRPHRISALRDLTERKQAQQALIESEEKYRLITENINDIICKLDEKLNFTFASSSVFNMLGYTVDEMFSISLKNVSTRESFQTIISNINQKRKYLAKNDPEAWTNASFESTLLHKNGTQIRTHINAKLINWGNNDTYEILCVARNIDEIKDIQFSLEENKSRLKLQNEEYERLNKELNLLNKELLAAKVKAEESDKLKSAFLANMSHEIRTPMNSIIGFSKMYQRDDLDEVKRKRYANFVINNSKQLLNIVNDILDLSKMESNQISIKSEDVDLNLLIDNLYQTFQENNNKGLYCSISKGLAEIDSVITSDGSRLLQILQNLTNNAYKFTKKGDVKFGYSLVKNNIVFFVEDTGIGISSEHQDNIFERFRQVEMETSRVFGGAGLGLSISQKLVEKMNGKIWVKSCPGKGSTFYFSIPFVAPYQTITNQLEIKSQKLQNTNKTVRTILIAEDDESNFIYLNEILIEYQFKIIWVKNGSDAVDKCLTNQNINLVLMDIKMPIMDGLEATQRIKKVRPTLPIIAQTAFAMADDKETSLKCGCDDYLSKPIDPNYLLTMIKQYI